MEPSKRTAVVANDVTSNKRAKQAPEKTPPIPILVRESQLQEEGKTRPGSIMNRNFIKIVEKYGIDLKEAKLDTSTISVGIDSVLRLDSIPMPPSSNRTKWKMCATRPPAQYVQQVLHQQSVLYGKVIALSSRMIYYLFSKGDCNESGIDYVGLIFKPGFILCVVHFMLNTKSWAQKCNRIDRRIVIDFETYESIFRPKSEISYEFLLTGEDELCAAQIKTAAKRNVHSNFAKRLKTTIRLAVEDMFSAANIILPVDDVTKLADTILIVLFLNNVQEYETKRDKLLSEVALPMQFAELLSHYRPKLVQLNLSAQTLEELNHGTVTETQLTNMAVITRMLWEHRGALGLNANTDIKLFPLYSLFKIKARFVTITRKNWYAIYCAACRRAGMPTRSEHYYRPSHDSVNWSYGLFDLYGKYKTDDVQSVISKKNAIKRQTLLLRRKRFRHRMARWNRSRRQRKWMAKRLRRKLVKRLGIPVLHQYSSSLSTDNLDEWDANNDIPSLVRLVTTNGVRVNIVLNRIRFSDIVYQEHEHVSRPTKVPGLWALTRKGYTFVRNRYELGHSKIGMFRCAQPVDPSILDGWTQIHFSGSDPGQREVVSTAHVMMCNESDFDNFVRQTIPTWFTQMASTKYHSDRLFNHGKAVQECRMKQNGQYSSLLENLSDNPMNSTHHLHHSLVTLHDRFNIIADEQTSIKRCTLSFALHRAVQRTLRRLSTSICAADMSNWQILQKFDSDVLSICFFGNG